MTKQLMMNVLGVVDRDTIQFEYTWLTVTHNMYRDLIKAGRMITFISKFSKLLELK